MFFQKLNYVMLLKNVVSVSSVSTLCSLYPVLGLTTGLKRKDLLEFQNVFRETSAAFGEVYTTFLLCASEKHPALVFALGYINSQQKLAFNGSLLKIFIWWCRGRLRHSVLDPSSKIPLHLSLFFLVVLVCSKEVMHSAMSHLCFLIYYIMI